MQHLNIQVSLRLRIMKNGMLQPATLQQTVTDCRQKQNGNILPAVAKITNMPEVTQ